METLKLKLSDYLIELGIQDPNKKFKCIHPDHQTDSDPSMSLHKDQIFVKCFGCLPPEQEVFTYEKNLIPIKDIEIGMTTIGLNGKPNKIIDKIEKDGSSKRMFEIRTNIFKKYLKFTEDHEHFVLNYSKIKGILKRGKKGFSFDKNIKNQRLINRDKKLEIKKTHELQVGDYLFIPKTKVLYDNIIINKWSKSYRYNKIGDIILNKEIGWLFGIYLAEGNSYRGGIRFTLHKDEYDYANKIKSIIEKNFNLSVKIDESRRFSKGTLEVRCSSTDLQYCFDYLFGKYHDFKKLPNNFLHIDYSIQKAILDGVFAGDGNKSQNHLVMTSKMLINQLKQICINNEIVFSYNQRDSYIGADNIIRKPTYSLYLRSTNLEHSSLRYLKLDNDYEGAFVLITDLNEVEKSNIVYDITTEDSSFMTRDYIVHNCQSVGTIFTVAHWVEGKPIDGPDFIKENVFYLADKFNIKYSIVSSNSEKAALKQSYFRAYRIVADFIKDEARENPTEAFTKEITKRKWKRKESIEFGVGCINKYSDIIDLLKANDFTEEFIDLAGLARSDMFNSDSVIFTIYDEHYRPIAFYTRDTKFEEKKLSYENSPTLEVNKKKPPMKYNSTANFTGIYEKPLFPYGLHDIKNFHKVILVEGHGCKHNLKLNGIDNVIALGGTCLADITINKLISLGVTTIVLMLDNDVRGRERIKEIINKFYGKLPIDLFVIDLSAYSDVKDPDEFLRKNSVELLKQLGEQNALEWYAINELTDSSDQYSTIESLASLIAIERSPIQRLKIENVISELTGIEKDVIHSEVEQKISSSKDRKNEYALKILDEARELVSMNPNAIGAAVNLIQNKIGELDSEKANIEDLYGSGEVLKGIVTLQEQEESGETIPIIKTGFDEFDKLVPIPSGEAFILVASVPNASKTTSLINWGLNSLKADDNTMVIAHTIDDSRNVYYNRFVACDCRVNMNWLKNPLYYLDEDMRKKRRDSYNIVTDFIRQDRLIVKDVTHGNSIEYHEKLVRYYRDKYPNRNILVFCDNFHKLTTELGYTESKVKFEYISGRQKSLTTKYGVVEINTVEQKKENMYEKPTDPNGIRETGALQYDANLIIYIWNDINARREGADLVFDSKTMELDPDNGYYYREEKKPIAEWLILKNKLSSFKGSLFFKLHPELAVIEPISKKEVDVIVNKNKKNKESGDSVVINIS